MCQWAETKRLVLTHSLGGPKPKRPVSLDLPLPVSTNKEPRGLLSKRQRLFRRENYSKKTEWTGKVRYCDQHPREGGKVVRGPCCRPPLQLVLEDSGYLST